MKISIGADGFLLLLGVLLSESHIAVWMCIICAAIHELGHIFAAAVMKIKLKELKLGFAGARIYPQNEMLPYKKEFLLCAAGPVFNLIFAAIGTMVLQSGTGININAEHALEILRGGEGDIEAVWMLCVIISLAQALVNLLPIEGLDGGRMTVCLISQYSNANIAWKTERAVTYITVVIMWILSIYLLLKTSSGIGMLICAATTFAKMAPKKH